MRSDDLITTQRALRVRLLDNKSALPSAKVRDFAAYLLLYMDDPQSCWRVAVEWLRQSLGADRVDGGYSAPGVSFYTPIAEALHPGKYMPSVTSTRFNARAPGIATLWTFPSVFASNNVAYDSRFSLQVRSQLQAVGVAAKLAVSLRDGSVPVGILCADWSNQASIWTMRDLEQFSLLTIGVLGPVLAAARELVESDFQRLEDHILLEYCTKFHLTPAEVKVVSMAVSGMSYKEISRQLNRSFSTIDHQLRSVRDKLGVKSTSRMISVLKDVIPRGI